MNVTSLRQKLLSNVSLGTWMQIPSPIIANILSRQTFDWIVLDLEHGRFSNSVLGDLFKIIETNKTLPFARMLSPCSENEISAVLDAGARGLIFPKIESVEQSKSIYKYSHLPPCGTRGVSFCHANNYGLDFDEYLQLGQSIFLVGMIETLTGVQNLKDIIAENIFDAFIVGPYDLSASLGLTGMFNDPTFVQLLETIYDLLRTRALPFGTHIVYPSSSKLNQSISSGCNFIPFGIDTTFLSDVVPTL